MLIMVNMPQYTYFLWVLFTELGYDKKLHILDLEDQNYIQKKKTTYDANAITILYIESFK